MCSKYTLILRNVSYSKIKIVELCIGFSQATEEGSYVSPTCPALESATGQGAQTLNTLHSAYTNT